MNILMFKNKINFNIWELIAVNDKTGFDSRILRVKLHNMVILLLTLFILKVYRLSVTV